MEYILFYESGKKRKGKEINCVQCKCKFVTRLTGGRTFCSDQCYRLSLRIRIKVECAQCGAMFEKTPSKIKLAKHGFFFCSRKCKDLGQSLKGKCDAIRPAHYGTSNGLKNYRSQCEEKLSHGCIGCDENRIYLLMVHHIDGNRLNNDDDNLEVVCGRCHMIRHLQFVNGEWRYSTCFLTPRNHVDLLQKGTFPPNI